jgi:hypothetical protein
LVEIQYKLPQIIDMPMANIRKFVNNEIKKGFELDDIRLSCVTTGSYWYSHVCMLCENMKTGKRDSSRSFDLEYDIKTVHKDTYNKVEVLKEEYKTAEQNARGYLAYELRAFEECKKQVFALKEQIAKQEVDQKDTDEEDEED